MGPISIFDIFMAVLALYVLISAFAGKGRIFEVQNVKEGREQAVMNGQRWLYLVIGWTMLFNAVASMLMSYFYEVQIMDNSYYYVPREGVNIPSFFTSGFLTTTTFVCMGVAMLAIVALIILIRKNTNRVKRGENPYQKAKGGRRPGQPPMPSNAFRFDEPEETEETKKSEETKEPKE